MAREYCTWYSRLIIKGANEQPDEEGHRARSRRVPPQELLSPWQWGVPPSAMWVCSLTRKPLCLGFMCKFSYLGMVNWLIASWWLTASPPTRPSSEVSCRLKVLFLLSYFGLCHNQLTSCSCLRTPSHKSSDSHLKDTPNILGIQRVLETLLPGMKDEMYIFVS